MVTALNSTLSSATKTQTTFPQNMYSQGCVSAARRVSKKYRMAALHKKEYRRLKKVLPSVSGSPKVSKVELIEEAIRYIDYLHNEITNRFFLQSGQFNPAAQSSPVAPIVRALYPASPPNQKMPPLIPVTNRNQYGSNANVRIRF